jgi:hypothetical protein
MILSEKHYCSGGSDSVSVFQVGALNIQPAERSTISPFFKGSHLVQFCTIDTDRVVNALPRFGVIFSIGADLERHSIVKNLADTGYEVAVFSKPLR